MAREPRATAIDMGDDYGIGPEPGVDHRPWADVLDAIAAARSWWICTTRPSGRAHAMPVWGVVADGRMLWSTGPDTVKARNLERDPRMVMHLESGDEVVIVEAIGRRVTAEDLPASFVAAYAAKYDLEVEPDQPGYSFWEVVPTTALVWSEAAFVDTAVKWWFDD